MNRTIIYRYYARDYLTVLGKLGLCRRVNGALDVWQFTMRQMET